MKNQINKGWNAVLGIIGILALSAVILAGIPNTASAYMTFYSPAPFSNTVDYTNSYGTYNNGYSYNNNYNNGNQGNNYNSNYNNYNNNYNNPSPYINSITPSTTTAGAGGAVITIKGNGFVSTSIAQFDGTNYPTTYVSSSELRMDVSSAAISNSGRYYVSVSNPAPGGGFSNPVPFTVNKPVAVNSSASSYTGSSTAGYANTSSYNSSNNSYYGASAGTAYRNNYGYAGTNFADTSGESAAALTSNAIFGSDSFLPTGILQWILFIILVLAIIFIWRRFFGSTAKYHATPLKHA